MGNNNNLQNQVYLYSVSTDAFFNDEENKIAKQLMDLRIEKKEWGIIKGGKRSSNWQLNKTLKEMIIKHVGENAEADNLNGFIDSRLSEIEELEAPLKEELNDLLNKNNGIRQLRHDHLWVHSKTWGKEVRKSNRIVSLFESSFTRTLNLSTEDVNEDVIIVKAYHYVALEGMIKKGFVNPDGKKYVFWASSSGQMKNKKCVFVKESALNRKFEGKKYTVKDRLTCGLDWETINEKGINVSKYLAYLSLQNTATTKWEDFDIDKVVICPDLEIDVTGKVEFIDRDTYEIHPPEEMTLPMNVSDGVGLIMPKDDDTESYKNFQFRIPWGKGLLSVYNWRKQAKLLGKDTITDVWGDTHNINDVEIILSASQLKTWKYYKSMDEYRYYFKKYECEAGKCNEEVDTKYINLSYQYLQSLEMEQHELEHIARMTDYDIHNIGSDKEVMLRSLGATQENEKKNHFQQALLMYDNLLNDSHAKEMVKSRKKSMVEDALSGTLRIEGKRMFVLPDLHAYVEFLLTGNKNPDGLLGKDEVFAKGIGAGIVDLMRSPQLYREHGIQKSVKNDKLEKWYKTGAIYVNNKNFLGRLLQFDFDGDQLDVSTNSYFNNIAKRNMKGIVPLYYKMENAPVQELSLDSIYDTLINSFGSAIGSISNDITKIWNSGKLNYDKMDAIKRLTMYNNFMIDYSKTNFLPEPKKGVRKEISQYTKGKAPYFFQWAKNKDKFANKVVIETVEDVDSEGKVYQREIGRHIPTVNMLEDIINSPRIVFKSVADKFDYRMLMSVKKFKSKGKGIDNAIIKAYADLNKNKKSMIDKESEEYKEDKYAYVSKKMKEKIMEEATNINPKITDVYVTDVLIHYFSTEKKNGNKKTMWECFGDIIVTNLNYNLYGIKVCQKCDGEFKAETHRQKYCSDECSHEAKKESNNKSIAKVRSAM